VLVTIHTSEKLVDRMDQKKITHQKKKKKGLKCDFCLLLKQCTQVPLLVTAVKV